MPPTITLEELPVGSLFVTADKRILGFKSEYGDNDGFIHAFVVGSGEYLVGDEKVPQAKIQVIPLPIDELLSPFLD